MEGEGGVVCVGEGCAHVRGFSRNKGGGVRRRRCSWGCSGCKTGGGVLRKGRLGSARGEEVL